MGRFSLRSRSGTAVSSTHHAETPPSHVGLSEEGHNHVAAAPVSFLEKTPASVETHERPDRLGLFLLNPNPSRPKEGGVAYKIDVVALHGITGDAYNTWTKDKCFWLRDILPDALPGARIFSYGYDARVILSKSVANLDAYSLSLLQALKHVRRKKEEQERRIIFICHSMGGIVTKNAINMAYESKDFGNKFTNIFCSTSAILFLATPHRGSDETKLPMKLASSVQKALGKPLRIVGSMRLDLIQNLMRDAQNLLSITEKFMEVRKAMILNIASFIELDVLAPTGRRVVDERSGVLGIENEVIPMQGCNHKEICRYKSKNTSAYKAVWRVLLDFADEANSLVPEELSDEDRAVCSSLKFKGMAERHKEASIAHKNTCNWIFDHESYKQWMKSPGLLWIKGGAGTGKSTLIAAMHNAYKRDPSKAVFLSFFFHGRGLLLQRTTAGMFRELLWQLYVQTPIVREPIREAFKDKEPSGTNHSVEWQVSELRELLYAALSRIWSSQTIMIFIDALDEAGSTETTGLLDFFHDINAASLAQNGKLRICISCRRYPVVSRNTGLEINVENHNKNDIKIYVESELRTGVVVWNQDATKTKSRNEIADTIVNNSQGVFQWARAVIPMVRDELNEGQSPSKVLKMLKEVPEELGTLYKHILTNVIKARYRRQTLLLMQWISFATRPLTMTEWRYAMSLGDAEDCGSQAMLEECDEFVDDDDRMGLLTATLSGGLAEVSYHKYSEGAEFTKVQFVHQSVKEYMDTDGLSLLLSQVDTECGMERNVFAYSSQRLARACMNYLSFDEVAATEGGEEAYKRLPFLEYACASWSEHLMQAEKMGLPQHGLIKYFEDHEGRFLKWSQLFYADYRRVVGEDIAMTWKYSHLIHLASDYNFISVVGNLLESGVSANEANSCGQRPLHYAALGGNTKIIGMLLDFGAHPAPVNRRGNTPLELAARNGHGEAVRLLLESGADLDTEGPNGSALCAAAYAGKKQTVRMLLSNGGNVNQQSGTLGNALQWASFGNAHFAAWPEVMQICLDFGADVNAAGGKYGNALQAASHKGDIKAVELLLNAGAEVNAKGGEYGTALQAASCSWTGNIELIALLLEHGALVNEQGGYYGNALIAASCKGYTDIVNLLLDKGADIHARGGLLDNCIQAAAYGNSLEIVEMLLERGAEANLLGGKNGNSMHAAAVDSGPRELLSILMRAGADVNSEGGEYGYPLQAASYGRQLRNIEAVQFLLESGAHVNAQGGKFGNALQAAARAGNSRIVEMLIRKGADVNAKGGAYGSALGAVKDDVEGRAVKRLLITAGARENMLVSSGNTDIEVVDMILPQP